MQIVPPRRFLILITLLAASVSAFAFRLHNNKFIEEARVAKASTETVPTPALILWAWERPEDLTFIDPQKTGVAYLAKTLFLRGSEVVIRPRLQPLALPPGTTVIPVVRIETDNLNTPSFSEGQVGDLAVEISKLALSPKVSMIQIDFDATSSQHQFYRALLVELRQRLPATTKISITALASWCQGDNWLTDLPIDEAVPMLFRMGLDRNAILSRLAGDGLQSTRCDTAAGISTDERIDNLPRVSRLYVFNPESSNSRGWNRAAVNKLMETYQR